MANVPHPPSGKAVELALWDTAGQEEYDRLRPLSYPETDLLFVCFAIDCPNSLENVMDKVRLSIQERRTRTYVMQWYPEVLHFCPTTPLMLLGLKSDLRNNPRCIDMLAAQGLTPVSVEQGRQAAAKMGATYMECSARENRNVKEIFEKGITIAVGDEWSGYKQMEQKAAKGAAPGTALPATKKKSRSCKIF